MAAVIKPVAPYDTKINLALRNCFDRETGMPVEIEALKSFKQALATYHLHPESKFHNGEYLDRGVTRRRYVYATAVKNIGKEANEWERQIYFGFEEEELLDYGLTPQHSKALICEMQREIRTAGGQRHVARESGVSRRTIDRVMKGQKVRASVLAKIRRAMTR